MILCLNGNSCWCVFGSASTLKEQFDDEKVALQQSIHKNGALIAEKEQLVQNLKSEVGIKHAGALKNSSRVFDSPVMRDFACCNLKSVFSRTAGQAARRRRFSSIPAGCRRGLGAGQGSPTGARSEAGEGAGCGKKHTLPALR